MKCEFSNVLVQDIENVCSVKLTYGGLYWIWIQLLFSFGSFTMEQNFFFFYLKRNFLIYFEHISLTLANNIWIEFQNFAQLNYKKYRVYKSCKMYVSLEFVNSTFLSNHFSSPEFRAKVSFSDRISYAVGVVVVSKTLDTSTIFENLLLKNHWANSIQSIIR